MNKNPDYLQFFFQFWGIFWKWINTAAYGSKYCILKCQNIDSELNVRFIDQFWLAPKTILETLFQVREIQLGLRFKFLANIEG